MNASVYAGPVPPSVAFSCCISLPCSGFWDVVAAAQLKVENTIQGLTTLQSQVATLSDSAAGLAGYQPLVTSVLTSAGLPGGAPAALVAAPAALDKVPAYLGGAIEFLQTNLNQVGSHLGGSGAGGGLPPLQKLPRGAQISGLGPQNLS